MPSRRECANAIRALSIDAIEKAKSGHPGAPLGMADMAEALWRHFLKHNPANPRWVDRDRFILSNGHASMLLYALLHLTGYDLPMEEIENFRQWRSRTPGHPERGLTPGVEMTTGPLGQGLASAVGIALAEAMLAARFNRPDFRIVDHYTYVFCGDGCLMEGVSHEACSLAGTWRLGKLIVLYDSNGVSIDGEVNEWFSENVSQRYAAYGWHVEGPIDGHNGNELDAAIARAKENRDSPSLLICKTHIGFGSPKRDTSASHGAPLGEEAAAATKKAIGWSGQPFQIPADILKAWDNREEGARLEAEWDNLFSAYKTKYPELAGEFTRRMEGDLPEDWDRVKSDIMESAAGKTAPKATRESSKDCLEILVPALPELIGGAADLSSSVGAQTAASLPLNPADYSGNYLFYGVREFGMGAIMNGLAMHGGFVPYAGTFLAFSDQAKNALRLSALMGLRVIWVMTHDSIGVGEDGPTHQPVEQIPAMRMTPNLFVWRPCDDDETAAAWISALEREDAPTSLVLSRQKLPQIERTPAQVAEMARGGYVLKDCQGKPDIILLASGSEVHATLEAAASLSARGVKCRVVSMPCAEVFETQSQEWRDSVLPRDVSVRLAIEAASPQWWGRYVGLEGGVIGMEAFGASAPNETLFKKFGFTAGNIEREAEKLLAKH